MCKEEADKKPKGGECECCEAVFAEEGKLLVDSPTHIGFEANECKNTDHCENSNYKRKHKHHPLLLFMCKFAHANNIPCDILTLYD